MISNKKIDFWIQNDLNVLLTGRHGVGKSSMVIDAFQRNKLKWKYFSASTMDPWVDFIGVPKEKQNEDGTSHLDLVRPLDFQNDDVEAIFFDELNRAHKKVRNAVMELIQFKSINGKKFENLKIIWAAINPEDDEEEEYDVEKLDPAQKDRFHIQVEIPYKPDSSYFKSKHGIVIGPAAIEWWDGLPTDLKNQISPRRLDYAVEIYGKSGDLRDVLPQKSNIQKLIEAISVGPIKAEMYEIMSAKDEAAAATLMADKNKYADAYPLLNDDNKLFKFFVPFMTKQDIATELSKPLKPKNGESKNFKAYILENFPTVKSFREVIIEIHKAGANKALVKEIEKAAYRSDYHYKIIHGKSMLDGLQINQGAPLIPVVNEVSTEQFKKIVNKLDNRAEKGSSIWVGPSTQDRNNFVEGIASLGVPSKIDDDTRNKIFKRLDDILHRTQPKTFNSKKYKDGFGRIHAVFNAMIESEVRSGKAFNWANHARAAKNLNEKVGINADDTYVPMIIVE